MARQPLYRDDALGLWVASSAEAVRAVGAALTGKPVSGHDTKETELALRQLSGGHREWAFSTFLAAYLLGAGSRDPRLEDLAREFLDVTLTGPEQLLGTGRSARKPAQVTVEEAAEFSARRAEAILNLRPRLEAEMRNLGVDYLFHEIELPLAGVLADMESEGVAVDVPYLKKMQDEPLSSRTATWPTRWRRFPRCAACAPHTRRRRSRCSRSNPPNRSWDPARTSTG